MTRLMISGGGCVNVVPERCEVRGEIRSMRHVRALALVKDYQEGFARAAAAAGATLDWSETEEVHAYETPLESGIVTDYRRAAAAAGVVPVLLKTFGGSDNNVFSQYGIRGLVLATAMNRVHSCEEYSSLQELVRAAELLVCLLERKKSGF